MSQAKHIDNDVPQNERPPVVVKKYANRRLYNTESSSYITLDTLADMVRIGRDFVVYDAKTSEDITRGVLTQIIGFYGDSMQNLVPKYLENAMTNFARQQEQMREAMQQTMGNFFPFGMEEVSRQNVAMMERAMSLFTPFLPGETPTPPNTPATPTPNEELASLRAEVEVLRAQLAAKKD
ncbi:MAG TPA: polyhydroxyalkanoate synthesis regulator DNA-binding domain-containing protein [Acetobacteraceae bacterium]